MYEGDISSYILSMISFEFNMSWKVNVLWNFTNKNNFCFVFMYINIKHTFTYIVQRKGKSRKKHNIVLLVHYYVIDVNYWKTIYPPTLVLSLMDLDTRDDVDVQGITRTGFWQLSQNTKEKQTLLAIHRCLIFIWQPQLKFCDYFVPKIFFQDNQIVKIPH